MHVCDIRLDLRKPDWDRPPVRVMRGDADATVVRAHILDGGEPADLSHAQARFEAVKPDGTWVREEAAAKPGGVVEYVLPPQVSAVEGLIEGACFRLVRDGAVDSAGPFAIEVLPSIESAGAGESGSYCPELDGLMDEMRQLIVDGGAKDYAALVGKPSIGGRTLEGDMALEDIG
ncbi:BppU family phage baseplate upper protein, partial [Eggerthella lenta]